ncbi:MAG: globin domain-containing protein [Gammaproteobacteria bacterium]|nr:globin domain-containing protein [Gammaproteobacteria bacterium]
MLSANIIHLEALKRSYSLLKENDEKIGKATYENMFKRHPELKKMFRNTSTIQGKKLIDAILFYCIEADNFELFYERLDAIAHVHIHIGIKNEYYPYMKDAFINAIRSVLKTEATDEIINAWSYGFNSLSNELIHIENLIRKHMNTH